MRRLRIYLICFISCVLVIGLAACGNEDEGGKPALSGSSILSFSIQYNGISYKAVKQDDTHWVVNLPESVEGTTFYGNCELAENVSINPSPRLLQDYVLPMEYTLSDGNGNTFRFTVSVTKDLNYYGPYFQVNDSVYYPMMKADGTFMIVLPADGKADLHYSVPEGGNVSPQLALEDWQELEDMEFTITDASGNRDVMTCRWTRDNYFTMVFLSDPEYDMRDFTLEGGEIKNYIEDLLALQNRTDLYFEPYPGGRVDYGPEIIRMGGDINKDNNTDEGEEFMSVFGAIYEAGIPCVTISGNHDWQPYHWGDLEDFADKNDYGYTSTGAKNNDRTLEVINRSISESEKLGVTDVHRFLSTDYGHSYREVSPFTFKFRGIRFYCGQCYWFQQWYKEGGLFSFSGPATFYNTDEIVDDLEKRIDEGWGEDPAVWVQHYPLVNCPNHNAKEWFQDRQGFEIDPAANQSIKYRTYDDKLEQMRKMIRKTKNPVAFAGHTHVESCISHNDAEPVFGEWVIESFHSKGIYVVLMKDNYGVIQVEKIQL